MGIARSFIEQHGGIRSTARKLGLPVSTVASWNAKDSIPEYRWAQIRELGTRLSGGAV